ncbi:MAG: hypothetical protein K6T16_00120 [Candidatus Pacearchaeota archaeon]|nr:hypothetical protein [Candidatus Pacearchaeota archaeon]
MVVYVRLEPSEELAIRRAILEAMASTVIFHSTGAEIMKLKNSKKYVMRGVNTSLKNISEELLRLRGLLPMFEETTKERAVEKSKAKTKTKNVTKGAAKTPKKGEKKKSKYEEELEKIRERIVSLS